MHSIEHQRFGQAQVQTEKQTSLSIVGEIKRPARTDRGWKINGRG